MKCCEYGPWFTLFFRVTSSILRNDHHHLKKHSSTKGVTATILKQGSNQAIRFFVMESLKDWYREGDPKKTVPKWIVGLFGGFAGACSVMGNTPLDVVKTRCQL
jgi:solute carrier family 25 citrate transporter 1